MQVVGMPGGGMGYRYSGAIDALRAIIRMEGVRGLYRGIWPNLRESITVETWRTLNNRIIVKVAPSIATSFFTYELVRDLLIAS